MFGYPSTTVSISQQPMREVVATRVRLTLTHQDRVTHVMSLLVQMMVCHLIIAKPLTKPIDILLIRSVGNKFQRIKRKPFSYNEVNLKRSSAKYRSLCLVSMRLQHSLSPLISWISRSIEVYVTSGNRSLTHRGRVTLMRVANYGNLSLGQMMACRLVDTKPLPERMMEIVNRAPRKKHRWKNINWN